MRRRGELDNSKILTLVGLTILSYNQQNHNYSLMEPCFLHIFLARLVVSCIDMYVFIVLFRLFYQKLTVVERLLG
jgi:hypothetical protein